MNVADFLLARIAEDEADARSAIAFITWDGERDDVDPLEWFTANDGTLNTVGFVGEGIDQHIVRWSTGRVLAECEAKRRIVDWCDSFQASEWHERPVLNMLALPYADHPDYREEWRP